jgi:hypothetical protein
MNTSLTNEQIAKLLESGSQCSCAMDCQCATTAAAIRSLAQEKPEPMEETEVNAKTQSVVEQGLQ